MGEKVDETEDIFGRDNDLFEEGKTPDMLKVVVNGIGIGDYYMPEIDPLPPNYIFHCYQDTPYQWSGVKDMVYPDGTVEVGGWICSVVEGLFTSFICQVVSEWGMAFGEAFTYEHTPFKYLNGITLPYCALGDGSANGFWIPSTESNCSIANVMKLLNIDRDPLIKYEPLTNADLVHIHRFCRKSDHTCLRVIMDS